MQINFPERGDVLIAAGAEHTKRFVTAPLQASFLLQSQTQAALGQPYTIADDAGTQLTYRLTAITFTIDSFAVGNGELIAVEHTEPNVISFAEHDAKLSAAIDTSFEAGRQLERQEAAEAKADLIERFDVPTQVNVLFADGSTLSYPGCTGMSEIDGELMLVSEGETYVGIHPSWRSYELVEDEVPVAEDADRSSVNIALDAGFKAGKLNMLSHAIAELGAVLAGLDDKPTWPPRYGPIGGNA